MSVRISVHQPDFSKAEVGRLSDNSWTIDLYDEDNNQITMFVKDSESIHLFGAQLITLTAIEKTNHTK